MSSAAQEAWQLVADMWFSDEIHNRFHAACQAVDLSPPQLKALLSLDAGHLEPMRALAEGWKCDASWVTGIVDGLEQRGFAERRVHPRDRRIKVVAITAAGEEAKARALSVLHEPPASLSVLNASELRQLRDLMAKLQRARQAQADQPAEAAL
jgi:DNA-binding MarR family transcriptional regulator